MKTMIRIFRKNLIKVIVFVFCLFLIPVTNAQLSGTYTINPAGGGLPNFISFDAAVSTLISQGVSGPVIINVAPGTYTVHSIIPQITGASSVNTITFKSSSTDSTLVTLSYTYTNSSTENYMFMLNGADYITFKSMTFNAYLGDASFGTVFQIMGGANNNKFLNNALYGKLNTSTYNYLIYSTGTKDENNVFENNLFFNGSCGINLSGVSYSTLSAGTTILNNNFRDQFGSSIMLKYQDAPLIERNKIDNSYSGSNGIYLEVVDRKYQILRNKIIMNRRSDGAIDINSCDGLVGGMGLIANNMISVITEQGEISCNGINISNSTYLQLYHNSVLISSGKNTVSNALYQSGGSNIDIRNNILANLASGYAYNVTNTITVSDYNDYYTNGNYLARWQNIDREELDDLITPSPGDEHSVSVNPVFNSDFDLHTTTFRLENKGTNLASVVSLDFDGETRSVSPDVGADEFITGTGSALSGVYYIGGSSPDFNTITEAVQQLNNYGILSSVVFNIRNDNSPYLERISILPVTGASEINTVTFQPDPSNDQDVIITYNVDDYNANYTIEMKRASYVKIKGLLLTSENNNYGTIIKIDGLCHHDTISACTIICPNQGGTHIGIYSSESALNNLFISKNKFNNGYYGILLDGDYYDIIQDICISENDFYENNNGINIEYGSNNIKILKNIVNSSVEGINISNYSGSLISKGLIANNFVYLTKNSVSAIGLNLNNVTYLQVYFNTVKISKENTQLSSKAISIGQNSNLDLRNNIFCNFGAGYAYYKSYPGSNAQSDYNALFTAGDYLSFYSSDQQKLSDLQAVSGKDLNSLDVNPAFITDAEVHINSPFLDGSGIAISGLVTDIDGEARNSPPDIGADEYISSLIPIPAGTYKIGGAATDYNTIKQAFDDLQIRGVSGPVIFEILKGEYNEFVGTVYDIPGCTESDSVIVRSESGNPEDVIIYYDSDIPGSEIIFQFKAVENFTLENLTISTSGSYWGSQIEISGSSENINILGNELISTSYSNPLILIRGITNDLLIRDNLISGTGGIGFNGDYNNYAKADNTWISGNLISEGGIGFDRIEAYNTHIIGNIISGDKGIRFNNSSKGTDTWIISNKISGTNDFAVELNYQTKLRLIGNTILASSGTGVYILYNTNNIPYYGLIANNMIQVGGDETAYGINIGYSSKRIYIYNNNINITNNAAYDSYGININENSSNLAEIEILNNVVSNSSGGWVLQNDYVNDITVSDYNNFYTTGTNFINWEGTTYANLAAFRSASGTDAHSLSLDPLYLSETDLHSGQTAFHQAGTPLEEVPYDIDSIPRDPVKPDIGAVEFTCGPPVFNVFVSPTCLGDTTILIDRSTNVVPGSTYGWDFDADFVPDAGYSSTKPGYTIKYYFNNPGVHYVNYIISQIGGCMDYTSVEIPVNSPPVLDINTTGAYCGVDDGEAIANITGGGRPFKYFWSNDETDSIISNLALGNYSLAVSDANGCTSDAEFTIENAIQVTVTQLNPSTCGNEDGSAEVTAKGGAKPYSYVWSDGCTTRWNTTLSPGRHYVNVIDEHECYSQGFVDIENDGGPQVTLEKIVHNKCYGDQQGSIDISITGAYNSIQWSNGATSENIENLAAGIYDVVVFAEDSCLGAGSFEVIQPMQIQISSTMENASCSGSDGKAMAMVSGGTKPYTYQWSPSGGIYQIEEGIPAGIYSVTVRDANACMAKIPVIVNSIGGPVVTINSITRTGCSDTTNGAIDIGISGGTPLYSFEWLPGGQTVPDISGLSPGTYEIKVTDQAGCVGVNTAVVEKTLPAVNPICLVTVDTITGKNMIVWEKLNTTDVDHYVIYRESSSKNIYQPIGTRPVDSLSTFIDSVADPMVRAWKYKLSVVDVCGNESPLSEHHKTIFLTMNQSGITNDALYLIWDPYEGFDVSTYKVFRFTTQTAWQNISNIAATNFNSIQDQPPTKDNLIYYIQTEHPAGCTATDLKGKTLNSTRSNRQNKLKITGFSDNYFSNLNLMIWPNPGSGIYNLSIENNSNEKIMLKIYDIAGKLVFINEYLNYSNTFETEIDISWLANGIYHLHILTGNTIFHRVLIKE